MRALLSGSVRAKTVVSAIARELVIAHLLDLLAGQRAGDSHPEVPTDLRRDLGTVTGDHLYGDAEVAETHK